MNCPVCRSVIYRSILAGRVYWNCSVCKIYGADYDLINPFWTRYSLLFISESKCPYDIAFDSHPALGEARVLAIHSEWNRWRDSQYLFMDPFHQSLFADWCADNGFPLQEAAVRQLLEGK